MPSKKEDMRASATGFMSDTCDVEFGESLLMGLLNTRIALQLNLVSSNGPEGTDNIQNPPSNPSCKRRLRSCNGSSSRCMEEGSGHCIGKKTRVAACDSRARLRVLEAIDHSEKGSRGFLFGSVRGPRRRLECWRWKDMEQMCD